MSKVMDIENFPIIGSLIVVDEGWEANVPSDILLACNILLKKGSKLLVNENSNLIANVTFESREASIILKASSEFHGTIFSVDGINLHMDCPPSSHERKI